MTDKYCPLRFREYDSNPHDQRCIGESCAWFDKCSQSHGEPRTATVETQTRVRTETDAETAQEPREAEQTSNTVDTREKLEADVLDAGCADEIDYDRIIGWLDRQAAITKLECIRRLEGRADYMAFAYKQADEERKRLSNQVEGLFTERDELRKQWDARDSDCIALEAKVNRLEYEVDELQAKVDEYENIEFVVPLEDADKYAMEPVGYIKAHILKLQAKVDELTAELERETLSACNSCAERIELQERVDELERENDARERALNMNLERIHALEEENAKLSSDELHWHSEADFWKRKYELICKALIDLNRNYVHVEDEGLA